jgi:SAM-dependent methyltransferase
MSLVVWHDIECGGYTADLPLWRELAADPVLDVGAGTGRVALDLAAHGHDVVALDTEAELLAELEQRAAAAGHPVRTLVADAESFTTDERFGAVLVPMQTLQLLRDRTAFFSAARRHLRPGGVLAAAIAEDLEPFEGPLVPPDHDGRFVSQPTAVRLLDDVVRLERVRDDGETQTVDVIELARVTERGLHAELRAAGLQPGPSRVIPATEDHVGSTVVVARA